MHRSSLIAFAVAAALVPLTGSAQTPVLKRLPTGQKGIIVQGGREAIGPKQDDPRSVDCGDTAAPVAGGQAVATIHRPGGEDDPKAHAGHGALAIGPKQDDPSTRGIIVQNGREAIGPKQDDPRAPTAVQQRPGDDNDPKARCQPSTGR